MASISRDANGTKRVCFTDGDSERKSVRLGTASVKAAEAFRLRIEDLLSNKTLGRSHDAELSAWLRDLPERMHARLARVGLVEPRARTVAVTLGNLLNRYRRDGDGEARDGRQPHRASDREARANTWAKRYPIAALLSITTAHADNWRKAIAEAGLATATVAKRVHVAKAIFRKAVKWGMISASPFADLRAGSQCNPDRAFYVAPESIGAILAACPDDQWRAIVALSRYAGLRCPSEVVALKWGDVNWERGRLMVRSPKTAGHDGHAMRVVPIAPELRPILLTLFEQAEPGTEAAAPLKRRDPAKEPARPSLYKIIARSGREALASPPSTSPMPWASCAWAIGWNASRPTSSRGGWGIPR